MSGSYMWTSNTKAVMIVFILTLIWSYWDQRTFLGTSHRIHGFIISQSVYQHFGEHPLNLLLIFIQSLQANAVKLPFAVDQSDPQSLPQWSPRASISFMSRNGFSYWIPNWESRCFKSSRFVKISPFISTISESTRCRPWRPSFKTPGVGGLWFTTVDASGFNGPKVVRWSIYLSFCAVINFHKSQVAWFSSMTKKGSQFHTFVHAGCYTLSASQSQDVLSIHTPWNTEHLTFHILPSFFWKFGSMLTCFIYLFLPPTLKVWKPKGHQVLWPCPRDGWCQQVGNNTWPLRKGSRVKNEPMMVQNLHRKAK